MRVKRIKRAYRILTFFKFNYQLTPPFNVLIDGTFSLAALQNQLNLREQIPKYLDGECELLTTKCVLKELESIGEVVSGGLNVCKQFEIAHCSHSSSQSASECLADFARKSRAGGDKFIICTQDDALREVVRQIPGVPVLYISHKTILLEKISEASHAGANGLSVEMKKLQEIKKEVFGEVVKRKKVKKVKGKNPLSCKKKKAKSSQVQKPQRTGERTASGKRKRSKKKPSAINSTTSSIQL